MYTEIEAKWLEIDHDEFREKLVKLGAEQIYPKTDMIRTCFDFPDKSLYERSGWVRVRDEGDKITMSYKQSDDSSLCGTKEICLEVDNYDNAVSFLENIGLETKSVQKTRRERWVLDGVEIDLDEWPWIPPYVEIEAPTEQELVAVAEKLGLKIDDAMHAAVDLVYAKYYDVTVDEVDLWPDIQFGDVPEWLEKVRRK